MLFGRTLYVPLAIMACCTVMFGSTFFAEHVYLDPEALPPMRYPQALLALMFLFAMLLPLSRKESVDISKLRQAGSSIAGLVGSMAFYTLTLSYLGFLLSGSLMLFMVFRTLRYSTALKSAAMALLFTGICWYVFSSFARISLPTGALTHF